MAKPTVSVELTEKELSAIFRRMDKHPSITDKISDAMTRLAPIRREANRKRKAERKVKKIAYQRSEPTFSDIVQAEERIIKARAAGSYTDRHGNVWAFDVDRWRTHKPGQTYPNVIYDENFSWFIQVDQKAIKSLAILGEVAKQFGVDLTSKQG